MRVSQHFKLGRTQPFLDFVDVPLHTDVAVFVDPTALRLLKSPWGHECASLVQHFFETVLKRIKAGDHVGARALLSALNERNEFHLGYSKKKSRGHAFGTVSASWVWGALSDSQAAVSGLLQDLEDTCLLIKGIGRDMISDAVCNIIRGPLVRYTQDTCAYHGIPTTPNVDSGPIWNPQTERWESALVDLPVSSKHGKIVLVPKILVRHELSYDYGEYFRHYLLPIMQTAELRANTGLVRLLKDGTPRVTKKDLVNKYGADKASAARQTAKNPEALATYKSEKRKKAPPPLDHEQLSEIEETEKPDWDSLIAELKAMPVGLDSASAYEDLIERILTALFYPSLCHPTKQHELHEGRKRIDITYTNEAKVGFFSWLSKHYPSAFVFVECKNYGRELKNPELDQLTGRFGRSRGTVGLLVHRALVDAKLFDKRCRDTANDGRGYVMALSDKDIISMLEKAKLGALSHTFPLLMMKFRYLID